MTGQIFIIWINAAYVDEEGPSSIFKLEAAQEKNVHCLQPPQCSYIRGSKYIESHVYLNLCSFEWLKRRPNLVTYLSPLGSLILSIDLLLGLIKEGSLFLKTPIDFEFCISGASCDHSDREFGRKEYLKQSCNWKKVSVFCVCHKSFH